MSSRAKKKGGLGVSRLYTPTVATGEAILSPEPVKEVELPEEKLEDQEPSKESAVEERSGVVNRLKRIALAAFSKDDEKSLPDFVLQLTTELTLDDADVLWEFASLTYQYRLEEDKTPLTDYFETIRIALEERKKDEIIKSGKGIPHYRSLVFESPLLSTERKMDEEHDSQLLRKDKPVRGAISCSKCGDNLVSTRQIQLRGMDEPSTNIYTCYTCSNLWSV